mmetsp:Transcript_22558/g.36713  ORF Transcript_22558/g.36713 Transcript_22558/m.36713 type:complete len:276 (+) Transcript_22558:381-1208(+)
MALFQVGPDRYAPSPSRGNYATINQRALTLVVGLVAVGLPIVLYLAAHNPLHETCFRYSISHFYYAPFWGTIFTGALVFIGAYLIVYQGEDGGGAEKRMSTYAGLGAFGVAMFPTGGWGCDQSPFTGRPMTTFTLVDDLPVPDGPFNPDTAFRLFEHASTIHYISAAVVFFFLAWFCFFVFTAIEDDQKGPDGKPTQVKVIRNMFYYVAGTVIVVAIIAMGLSAFIPGVLGIPLPWWDAGHWTFWCEAAALIAFGISWLVKGRFISWLQDKAPEA